MQPFSTWSKRIVLFALMALIAVSGYDLAALIIDTKASWLEYASVVIPTWMMVLMMVEIYIFFALACFFEHIYSRRPQQRPLLVSSSFLMAARAALGCALNLYLQALAYEDMGYQVDTSGSVPFYIAYLALALFFLVMAIWKLFALPKPSLARALAGIPAIGVHVAVLGIHAFQYANWVNITLFCLGIVLLAFFSCTTVLGLREDTPPCSTSTIMKTGRIILPLIFSAALMLTLLYQADLWILAGAVIQTIPLTPFLSFSFLLDYSAIILIYAAIAIALQMVILSRYYRNLSYTKAIKGSCIATVSLFALNIIARFLEGYASPGEASFFSIAGQNGYMLLAYGLMIALIISLLRYTNKWSYTGWIITCFLSIMACAANVWALFEPLGLLATWNDWSKIAAISLLGAGIILLAFNAKQIFSPAACPSTPIEEMEASD